MGACLSCCGKDNDARIYEREQRSVAGGAYVPPRRQTPDTDADRAARAAAADA
ncbi:hypothetical protein H632_c3252p0, partial [Helicosporidium sp. ATCC 50920]